MRYLHDLTNKCYFSRNFEIVIYMKKLILSAFTIANLSVAIAQNSAVVDASLYKNDGDLANAKTSIDKAVVHEKTINSAKAWYVKGEVYKLIAASEKPEIKALSSSALTESYDAFKKAISLDKPNGSYAKDAKADLEQLWPMFINEGVNFYKNKQYKESIQYYTNASEIKPTDTTAYFYSTYAAQALEDFKLNNELNLKLISLNIKSLPVYSQAIHYARETDKNYEQALSLSEKAKVIFPKSTIFYTEDFYTYVAMGNLDLAKQKAEEAIARNPNDATLYNNLGVLSEKLNSKEKSVEYYKKAISLDPNFLDSYFNLGAYYYNLAMEDYNIVNKIPAKDYVSKGKPLEDKAKGNLTLAMPNFEKVYELKPEQSTKKILIDIYTKLRLVDKRAALMAK